MKLYLRMEMNRLTFVLVILMLSHGRGLSVVAPLRFFYSCHGFPISVDFSLPTKKFYLMEKNRFLLVLSLLCLTFWHQAQAQITSLVCNDLVFVSLDEDCAVTIKSEMVLEGGPYCCYDDYIVEFDKTAPLGNGPWVQGDLTKADVGKTYQVRITDPASGNKCWGNIKAEDKLPAKLDCTGLTTVNLDATGIATLLASDVQVTATDACSDPGQITFKVANNQTSIQYTCSELGLQVLTVRATDAIGNTSSCQAAVLVADPLNKCLGGCATNCPPAQVVTYEQGVNVLLPALNAGDLSPFAAYGAAEFDGSCQPADTNYTVTYHPLATGYSSFKRTWELIVGGFPFGKCEQTIAFPTARVLTVSGKVFVDSIQNCLVDAGEPGTNAFKILSKKLPGNQSVIITPQADGSYSFNTEMNALDSILEVSLVLPNGISTACPTVLSIPATTPQLQQTMDFGLFSELECPLMEVSISNNTLRRCFSNNTYWVKYCNLGFQAANNAYITVQLDSLLSVINSSIPFTQNGQLYTFQVGNVPRFTCKTFTFNAKLSCDALLGQTVCAEATIYPHEPCGAAAWSGPEVKAQAACEGDSVRLTVRNVGQQDMAEVLNFIVVEDILMRNTKPFNLKAGEAVSIKVPANGATWRIEAEQVTGYPEKSRPSATVESCGGLNTPGLVNAFAMNDDPLYIDMDCSEAVGAVDPNDKTAAPTGYNPAHIIRANTDLEYKIRFQNTGTDTAFTVVIVDTLSQLLDWASLEAGVSSHPYRLDVSPGGVLRFVFTNILLPDSNVNEAASHGFVKFRIAQRADLPVGTVIENTAGIYFDFNDAVVTNTAFHTIGAPHVVVSTNKPYLPEVGVILRPNPFQDRTVLAVTGYEMRQGLLRLYNAQGQLVQSQIFEGNQCSLERGNLLAGAYFFQIMDQGKPITTGKVQVH